MIQELLGTTSSSLIGPERQMFSINNSQGALQATTVPSPSSGAMNTVSSAGNSPIPENLRCPRCDSANTKFCYYNNYNLTQPRHFCKTCRRYWTKGGALRNVPIGGGCRKNKSPVTVTPPSSSSTSSAVTAVKSLTAKMKMTEAPGLSGFDFNDVHFPASPVLWGSPQNSHLLALLGSAQDYHQSPSPNPNPNPSLYNPSFLGRSLGLDPVGQGPPLGLCSSNWRSFSPLANQNRQSGFTLVDHQSNGNAGIQELYQRLRSSSGNFNTDPTAVVLSQNHVGSSPSSVIESTPVNGGGEQLGFWSNNSAFSWPDLPATTTTNGAYP